MKKGYILEYFLILFVKGQQKMKEIYTQEELDTLLEKPKKHILLELRTWTIIWTLASTEIMARKLRELQVKNVIIPENKNLNIMYNIKNIKVRNTYEICNL